MSPMPTPRQVPGTIWRAEHPAMPTTIAIEPGRGTVMVANECFCKGFVLSAADEESFDRMLIGLDRDELLELLFGRPKMVDIEATVNSIRKHIVRARRGSHGVFPIEPEIARIAWDVLSEWLTTVPQDEPGVAEEHEFFEIAYQLVRTTAISHARKRDWILTESELDLIEHLLQDAEWCMCHPNWAHTFYSEIWLPFVNRYYRRNLRVVQACRKPA